MSTIVYLMGEHGGIGREGWWFSDRAAMPQGEDPS
jgi:hypothetical protein